MFFSQIQQKEVSRVRSDITRDHMQEKRLEMISRMPQLTRIIRSYPSQSLIYSGTSLTRTRLIKAKHQQIPRHYNTNTNS